MMRSSRADRPPFFSGLAKSSSSARSSSRSRSVIAALVLEAHKRGRAFRHSLFPSIGRTDRGEPPPFLLEFESPNRKLFSILRRQARALGGNCRLHLLQTFL